MTESQDAAATESAGRVGRLRDLVCAFRVDDGAAVAKPRTASAEPAS